MTPQLKKVSAWWKVICGCECCISNRSMNSYLLLWRDNYLKKLKDQSHSTKNRRSVRIYSRIFEIYNNSVMLNGFHIYKTYSDMAMEKCVHIHSTNMHHHSGNMCCFIVNNVHVFISKVRNHIRITQINVLQQVLYLWHGLKLYRECKMYNRKKTLSVLLECSIPCS